jgi:hypothetical protein
MMIDRTDDYLAAAGLEVEIWVVFKHWIPAKMGNKVLRALLTRHYHFDLPTMTESRMQKMPVPPPLYTFFTK